MTPFYKVFVEIDLKFLIQRKAVHAKNSLTKTTKRNFLQYHTWTGRKICN